MASSGKKGKTKWKPVETSQIINPSVTRKLTTSSWADESVNDLDDTYDFGRKATLNVALPTAPRAARGPENDANIPKEPPFQAYLSNLSYEVTEDDLHNFFAELRVKSVRLPRDDRGNNKAKGFGYVEFEDRNSLIEALSMPDTTCKNRRMRIEVAENGDQGRGGRGGPRDRGPNEPDRTMGDWRSGPRMAENDSSDRDGYRSGPRRDYGGDRGGSGMYDRDRRPGGGFRDRDDGFRSRDGGFRENRGFGDRGGFRDDRGGGFRDDRGTGGDFRSGGFRDDRPSSGGFREDRERGGYDRRGGGDYDRDRGSTGSTWRREPERDRGVEPPPPPSDRNEPKTRTRLNLQPRSRPLEETMSNDGSSDTASVTSVGGQSTSSSSTATSIFGGARPVDTAAREREIEERLAKQRETTPATPSTTSREESRLPTNHTAGPATRDTTSDAPSPPQPSPLEPAPPPKENAWARRSQHPPSSQVNNGRISPHDDGEVNKQRDSSPNNEPRKYQPPRKNAHDEKKRDERGPPRGEGRGQGGAPRGGGGLRNPDTRQQAPPAKPREPKREIDDSIRMPKLQEHQTPNFVGSNKFAFLEESESAAD
ncbi:eukaryotic translation initiation factor 4B isoform X2 [Macrosteles quadrilineatus]|uniref:eukaryotic translation initiation factor 4B isoform X2 n=1 Tax=Macrosteles quadrilineatus TaxID=74068 RepID=UPI0023E2B3D5|nr:eukaryotic translation initiation factor 4B isoform X2 [Macrosteles quadrilineatus]